MTRSSRLLALGLAAFVLGVVTPASAQGPQLGRGPFLLALLPSLGVVTWRCGTTPGRYGLGFRGFVRGATTEVRLVVNGGSIRRARVDPGRAVRLPLRGVTQTLRAEQFTGAGTMRAAVVVRFRTTPRASHCYGYSPPGLVVRVTPRQ